MVAPTHTSRITGQDAVVKIPNSGGNEIAITNVTLDIDVGVGNVQTNQGLKPDKPTTSLDYSGSFEYDGAQDKIRSQLFYSASDENAGPGEPFEPGEPKQVTMTIKEEDPGNAPADANLPRTWTVENVKVTGMSRDIPSDAVASTSWDYEAEDAYVSSGGADGTSSRSSN